METFYKAVRPDGTDFYTGTVDYASHQLGIGTFESRNGWLPELPHVDNPSCCSGDVYHVSTSAADTLIGGSWPCRLFEVEAEAVAEEENTRGVYTMRVIRELPAWQALGPNGEAVAALIEKAGTITEEQAEALHAAWHTARDTAWHAAWYAAWHVARDAARALLVKDLIATEQFDILYGPWASVMEV